MFNYCMCGCLLFRLTLTELGDMALRGKPLRMAESRNWIKLLTTSLAAFVCVGERATEGFQVRVEILD